MRALLLGLLLAAAGRARGGGPDPDNGLYDIGVGIGDVTGPAAGVMMMGYANPRQRNEGIHFRLFARAFLVDDGDNRLVYVSADMGMMGQLVKMTVIEELQKKYNDTYTTQNVILSGIHTHSGPGGYLQYAIFDISTFGWVDETFHSVVSGIVKAIDEAHNNVQTGRMYVSRGNLTDASINRSPSSYLRNPQEERDQYEHDTDKVMTVVRFTNENGTDIGMLNWFAVHATSMNNTNKLISGDNKGLASHLFEEAMNPPGTFPGEGQFVAGFAQANCGDISPNTAGPRCQDTGLPCDVLHSTCNGRTELCWAAGPGRDMQESTHIIAKKQFQKAMELFKDANATMLKGPVQHVSQQVNMSSQAVTVNGTNLKTCGSALGYAFAAGTTDGPGEFDFTQGTTSSNPFWRTIINFIEKTSDEQIKCHHPKPVLLSTSQYHYPYDWHPQIVETQLARVGQLAIIAVPGEFTTMSGRRTKRRIADALATNGVKDAITVISGLSNVYSHYIATWEEYQAQRYEAASTLYGPNTLEAYIQQYERLSAALVNNTTVPPGPTPPNLYQAQLELELPILFDGAPFEYDFGDVLAEPYPLATAGETIEAIFVSGHPRNDPQLGGSFLTVERQVKEGMWQVIAKDTAWSTKFHWKRISTVLGTSTATVYWETPADTPAGTYRISHTGHHKSVGGFLTEYTGYTKPFKIQEAKNSTVQNSRANLHLTSYNVGREEFVARTPGIEYFYEWINRMQ